MSAHSTSDAAPPIEYTTTELRSYLPSGWELLADHEPEWDGKKKELILRVLDSVDFDWPVVVSSKDVEEHGRMEALRLAMGETFRSRLGRPTRGLGISRRR